MSCYIEKNTPRGEGGGSNPALLNMLAFGYKRTEKYSVSIDTFIKIHKYII